MFAYLGDDIKLGVSAWTAPTNKNDSYSNDLVKHAVVSGKPVVQKMGQALDIQKLDFYCCEKFCDPQAELLKLKAAYKLSTPLPLVFGNGDFDAIKYTVEKLDVTTKRTTSSGKIVQFSASMDLVEATLMAGLSFSNTPAGIAAKAAINPLTRR